MMKKTLLSTAVAGALMAGTAQAGVSMNIGVTNNYLWRGVTQTTDRPAVSGGIDYSHDSGFYAGAWVSNVDWTQDTAGNTVANFETDLYVGFTGELAGFGYDVGYIYYAYPIDGANAPVQADFGEIYGIVSWKMLNFSLYKQVNQEAGGANQNDAYYLSLDASWDLGNDFSLSGLVGYYGGDLIRSAFGDTYTHLYAGVTKSTDFGDVTFALEDNNLAGNAGDPRLTVSWSREF